MKIFIGNKLAVLKSGSSFEYISENRLFSGSDDYTLSISFPLRGCLENIEIFGNINRKDVTAQRVIFDCKIVDRSFCKVGSIVVIEINEAEVTAQFLEGRSEQNFNSTFDKTYINELVLGSPALDNPAEITPEQAWSPGHQNHEAVALPWWNDSSDGLAHNFAEFKDGKYVWAESTTDLTWQPYLLFISKKICQAVGYTPDFTNWERSEQYKYLLICNTLPGAWDMPDYAGALPHWTVDEYFEKLELFLGGEFNIDHRDKRITFEFTQDVLRETKPIEINQIIDEFSAEIKVEDDQCEYIETKNIAYKDSDNDMWKYCCCDWFINKWKKDAVVYDSLNDLINDNKWLRSWNGRTMRESNINRLLYAKDVDLYYIVRPLSRTENGKDLFGHTQYIYKCVLQPVNIFGGRIVNEDEDAKKIELEFVPARIDHTEDKYGFCLFLSFSSFSGSGYNSVDHDYDEFKKTIAQSRLLAGNSEKGSEYYDRIYLAYWDGALPSDGIQPHPLVENVVIADDWSSWYSPHFSLRLNDSLAHRIVHTIDPKKKTKFKFISDSIPDVRAVFFIRGKRYVCEKVTATFTDNGMSQLLSGEFYEII